MCQTESLHVQANLDILIASALFPHINLDILHYCCTACVIRLSCLRKKLILLHEAYNVNVVNVLRSNRSHFSILSFRRLLLDAPVHATSSHLSHFLALNKSFELNSYAFILLLPFQPLPMLNTSSL